jgi:hypothetical protein
MNNGIYIRDFVKKTLKELQESIPKEFLIDRIDFDVSILTTSNKKDKIDIKVVQYGSDVKDQILHRITFSLSSKEASDYTIQQLGEFFKNLGTKHVKSRKSK